MKKALALVLILVLVLSLSACGGQPGNTSAYDDSSTTPSESLPEVDSAPVSSEPLPVSSEEEPSSSEESSEEESPYPYTMPTIPADLSTDPESFQFALDGTLLTLPVLYSEFVDLGWTCPDIEGETIKSGFIMVGALTLEKGDAALAGVSFVNLTQEELPATECYIYGFTFNYSQWNADTAFVIPGGLHVGVTVDEVLAAYGEPTERKENDTTTELIYTYGEENRIAIRMDNDKSLAPFHNRIQIARQDLAEYFLAE
jgi:hypothetical protein